MPKILVIDDEQAICWAFRQLLGAEGHQVLAAASAEEGLELCGREHPDLCILDIRLPGLSGLQALPEFRRLAPEMPVLVMTAHGTMDTAIEAIRKGAYNYLIKPIHNEDVLNHVRNALRTTALSREVCALRKELSEDQQPEILIGKSPAMQEIYKKIGAIAASSSSVLIQGESGTGKELVAKAIHRYSDRAKGPFVAVNCASMPEALLESELYGHVKGAFTGAIRDKAGKAETADEGTLFLDEIGEMPLSTQAKLLRFLEQKRFERVGSTESIEVDVRIIAATNRNLTTAVAEQRFREDLYFRLNVISVDLPSLRSRKDDIPLLVAHFLHQGGGRGSCEIGQEAMKLLKQYDWPGNVRELRNAIEHAGLLARNMAILPEHLPDHLLLRLRGGDQPAGRRLEDLLRSTVLAKLEEAEKQEQGKVYDELLALLEKVVLEATLKRVGGNQVKASRLLGIHRTTLRNKIEEHGIG